MAETAVKNEYSVNQKLADKCIETIRACAKQLGVKVQEEKVMRPPFMWREDDNPGHDLVWTAQMIGAVDDAPEVKPDVFTIGGRLNWNTEEPPSTGEVILQLTRSCMFSMTVALAPERDFIYQALEATRFSQNSVLLGMYIHDALVYMQENPPDGKRRNKFPSAHYAMEQINMRLEKASEPVLQMAHKRLQDQFSTKEKIQ